MFITQVHEKNALEATIAKYKNKNLTAYKNLSRFGFGQLLFLLT